MYRHRYDTNKESTQQRYEIDIGAQTTYVNRHGTNIQPIKSNMGFIYARCEIHVQRCDSHIASIQHRYDIDIRFIEDVYESTWH